MTRALLVVLLSCCARAPQPDRGSASAPANTASAAPSLERMAPDTVAIGRGVIHTLELTGRGFAQTDGANRVQVGKAVIDGVSASAGGTKLRFSLPLTFTDTTARGRPSGFVPGRYPVTVMTSTGTSNALTLTMVLR
jgi:hypothetical protein